MAPDDTFDLSPGVAHREIEGELLLLTPNDDVLYTLNGTGRLVWEMLLRGADRDEMAARIAATYGVPVEVAGGDLAVFFADLERRGVLLRRR
jgi:hypothetical protein